MNPAFKFNLDDMENEHPDKGSSNSDNRGDFKHRYSQPGHTRNICFVWPNNRRFFLNYSYLISGEFLPDQSLIALEFTTHTIHIEGFYLQRMFDDIMHQLVIQVICEDPRYNSLKDSSQSFISSIRIEKAVT